MPLQHTHHADQASPATAAVNRSVTLQSAVPCYHTFHSDSWRMPAYPIPGRPTLHSLPCLGIIERGSSWEYSEGHLCEGEWDTAQM